MNVLFRDGAYIPIETETKFNDIDYNSLIGRYDVIIEEDGIRVLPRISPILMFTRDINWTGDHIIMYYNDVITVNLGAKIYNHSKIDFKNSDFRLNDAELDSTDPYYGIYELYNINIPPNSISSLNIGEYTFQAQLKNVIRTNLDDQNPICYRSLSFTPNITIPKGNIIVMGVIEKNMLLSYIDTLIVDQPAYIDLYKLSIIKSTLKKDQTEHGIKINMNIENHSDVNQELSIILDLDDLRLIDYEGDMEYKNNKLVRDVIIPARSKKELSGTIIF